MITISVINPQIKEQSSDKRSTKKNLGSGSKRSNPDLKDQIQIKDPQKII